ncbi:MAG: molybdenum cofactor cytidylyltransferase [Oceanicoccus sp.]|jgi:molybdenum cofactor cytidylyltransferase
MTCGVLLLAAGKSKRFGSDKRRYILPDGRSLLEHAIGPILEAQLPLKLVVSKDDLSLQKSLQERQIEWFCVSGPDVGMGISLAQAVAEIPADWSSVVITLADMPAISADTYLLLQQALLTSRIVVPAYRGRRGNPVGFSADYFGALRRMGGDSGARQLVLDNASSVLKIECNDPGVLLDIDVPADLQRL